MSAERIGQVLDGKYKLVRLLGAGGMGAVYEGENVRIHRRVAIKMLHAEVSSHSETVTRFEREASAAGRIGSEHICEVLDLGVLPDATRYMVMEYLEGETLSDRIKRFGRLAPEQCVPLFTQVLDALGAAHAAGIVHRDLKPDNVWIVPSRGAMQDFVKILDFGVSKFSQAAGGEEMSTTRAGMVVGTPYYMSPEQARGMGQIDARTDVYAIGVVLYQASTGQVPYQAETFNELLFKIVLDVPPPPQTYVPNLDPEFAGIIQRAMMREPAQRFQSCAEFKAALVDFQSRRAHPGAAPAPQPKRGVGGTASMNAVPTPGPQPAPAGVAATWQSAAAPQAPAAGPMPTGAAWGNASTAGAPPAPPRSSAGVAIAAIVGIVVLGAAIGGFVFLRGGPASNAAGPAATTATTATAVTTGGPPPPATPAPATASGAPSAEPSATPSAAPSESASATGAPPSAAPHAPPQGGHGGKPAGHLGGQPPPNKPPSKPGGTDLGY